MDLRPQHGARFVIERQAETPGGGAIYRAVIHWPDREERFELRLERDGKMVLEPAASDEWAAGVIAGLGRSIVSTARASGWPAKLTRWRGRSSARP